MSLTLEPFRGPLFQAIGWALVHFLWQGVVLAVLLRALLGALRGASASTRYVVACVGLVLMAAAPVIGVVSASRSFAAGSPAVPAISTRAAEPSAGAAAPRLVQPGVPAASAPASDGVRALLEQAGKKVHPWLPLVVLAWIAGVLLGSARLVGGWVHLQRLRTRWTVEVSPAWATLLDRLVREMGITRPVRLLGSMRIDVPAVIGAFTPVVLVPASLLTGLSPRDVELILAHELAHVRRHDYLVNLLQTAVETVLFFHPAVWWLSGVARDEREHCCDDVVVGATGHGRRYARALLAAEELCAARSGPRLAPAMNGGSLYRRVRRLVTPRQEGAADGGGPLGVALTVMMLTALVVGQTSLSAGEPPAAKVAVVASAPAPRPGPLLERWREAQARAGREGWPRYWIGYAVRGSAGRNVGSSSARGVQRDSGTTVRDVLARGGAGVVRLGDAPTGSEVTIFFGMEGTGKAPRAMRIRGADLPVELEGAPVVWLGSAPPEQSLGLLDVVYTQVPAAVIRGEIAAAASLHAGPAALAFVERVLRTDRDAEVRAEAAFWLQHQRTPGALALLELTAVSDSSPKVREEAVTGIAKTGTPEARAALARLERGAPQLAVRREAGDWLMRGSAAP
ncbi:MAG TPA: M56 family metallopeptidase [Longimicrobium sp.]|nr:M56 family metallopeptidase [Longimicrobium sp.]